AFCKWRTDRVFEYILVREGVIKWEPDQDRDTYFTIEKYFAGKFKGYAPDTSYKYIPYYNLPRSEQWKYATQQSDSAESATLIKSRKKIDHHCLLTAPYIHTDVPV